MNLRMNQQRVPEGSLEAVSEKPLARLPRLHPPPRPKRKTWTPQSHLRLPHNPRAYSLCRLRRPQLHRHRQDLVSPRALRVTSSAAPARRSPRLAVASLAPPPDLRNRRKIPRKLPKAMMHRVMVRPHYRPSRPARRRILSETHLLRQGPLWTQDGRHRIRSMTRLFPPTLPRPRRRRRRRNQPRMPLYLPTSYRSPLPPLEAPLESHRFPPIRSLRLSRRSQGRSRLVLLKTRLCHLISSPIHPSQRLECRPFLRRRARVNFPRKRKAPMGVLLT